MWYEWRAYVPAAQRRLQAERELRRLRKKGQAVSPVVIEGRTIARTFWGKAWCDNLEGYSDGCCECRLVPPVRHANDDG